MSESAKNTVRKARSLKLLSAETLDDVLNADPFESFRVLTTNGIRVVECWPSNRHNVIRHWRAIRTLIVDDDPSYLVAMHGTRVYREELDCNPASVRRAYLTGALRLPASPSEPVPWRVTDKDNEDA